MSRVENGKSKRRDYKRENFPGLTVSYRGLVEYQTEIVSAWRTRDKLPFLSFSPSLVPRSPIVIYTSIFGSIIFSLLSIVFRHICAYICTTDSHYCWGKYCRDREEKVDSDSLRDIALRTRIVVGTWICARVLTFTNTLACVVLNYTMTQGVINIFAERLSKESILS